MTRLSVLSICALAFSTAGIASAASFTLTAAATVGDHQLAPGQYGISVKGDQAIVKVSSRETLSVPVKIEPADKKFDATSVSLKSNAVAEIDLAGSRTKLLFKQ